MSSFNANDKDNGKSDVYRPIVGQKQAASSFFDLRTMANRNMRRPFVAIVNPVSRDISNTRVTWGNPPRGTPQHYRTTRQGRAGANVRGFPRSDSFPSPGAKSMGRIQGEMGGGERESFIIYMTRFI